MRLEEFISIFSELNGGSVICDHDDAEILLGEGNLKLYTLNEKYYFLSEYDNNYDIIENSIKSNQFVKEIKTIRPNNSYLILLNKIKNFYEEISKKIIKLEENEFFYKRYVFYYTEKEFTSFKDWYYQRTERGISSILETEECSPESQELYMQFLLRLLIKIPFLKLEFKKMELENFDDLLNVQLNGIRKNKVEIYSMYERLTGELEECSPDEIAETLFSEIIGGFGDENQIN